MKSNLRYNLLQHLLRKKEEGGFTLIELLVVIIIIGILAAIALPTFLNQASSARETEARTNLGAVNRAVQAWVLETGQLPDQNVEDDSSGQVEKGLCALDAGLGDCDNNEVKTQYYGYALQAVVQGRSEATADPSQNDTDKNNGVSDAVIRAFRGCTTIQGEVEIAEAPRGDGTTGSAIADAQCTITQP